MTEDRVIDLLETAGRRGASHEDFVEAGLARDYAEALRRLVDDEGVMVRVDFSTGSARWALSAHPGLAQRAA